MIAVLFLFAIAAATAGLCRLGLQRLRLNRSSIEKQINAHLPQTQCGLCGYVGCPPYARAIAKGEADINRCPPGGEAGIEKLARLLKVNPKPLDTSRGISKSPAIAVIDEARCIGCTLCIQACPVDAVIGAAKQMHTVLRRDCTGCELCIPPCPVDCIDMRAFPAGIQ
jgi:Na+-translocating ferredoxin:NAD+ oxidoreductase subunit B